MRLFLKDKGRCLTSFSLSQDVVPGRKLAVHGVLQDLSDHCPLLVELSLESVNYRDVPNVFGRVLQNCPHLERLTLWDVSDLEAGDFSGAGECLSLQEVRLDSTIITAEALKVLATCCPNLTKLGLDDDSDRHQSVTKLLSILRCSKLQGLQIKNFDMSLAGVKFEMLTERCPDLCALDLSPYEGLENVSLAKLSRLQSLCYLNLGNTEGVTDAALEELAAGWSERSCALQVLIMCGCANIHDDGVIAVISKAKDLRRLDLEGTEITDASLLTVAHCSRLQVLVLTRCEGISDVGLCALAGGPGQPGCREMQSLDIAFCSIIEEETVLTLVTGLKFLRFLGVFIENNLARGLLRHLKPSLHTYSSEECSNGWDDNPTAIDFEPEM
ncbi:hypothetical protein B484DRAFT_447379 [Ochromonadaceae sp. CCMP2298]|nr:hypothetical protein B484DRAFT_447379 [Ochromonadaceae sp. CCMP2298]